MPATQQDRKSAPASAPWKIVWVAFLVRIAYMTLAHTWQIRPYGDHFQFGWEMGRIGRALATGYGFADPFGSHTGPTAWVTPLYPLLIGGVFKVLGVYTAPSAWLLLAINCVFSALMVSTTWELGARCFNPSVARWSAWIWALYPAAMQYAVRWVWEMTITAFLFSWVLVLALRMRNIGGPPEQAAAAMTRGRWAWFGLLWGLIALSNPSLLLFLPFCGLWILAGAADWKRQTSNVVLASCLCLASIAPWSYRNWRVFQHFVPMRANFGAEFAMGNSPGANGLLIGAPVALPSQMHFYQEVGEIAYAKTRGREAIAYISRNRGHFLALSLRRVYYYWAGVPHSAFDAPWIEYGRNLNFCFASVAGLVGLALALHRRVPASALFAMALLVVPLVYYFVFVQARQRHPIEPLLVVLGVYLFQSATRRGRKPDGSLHRLSSLRHGSRGR